MSDLYSISIFIIWINYTHRQLWEVQRIRWKALWYIVLGHTNNLWKKKKRCDMCLVMARKISSRHWSPFIWQFKDLKVGVHEGLFSLQPFFFLQAGFRSHQWWLCSVIFTGHLFLKLFPNYPRFFLQSAIYILYIYSI